MLKRLGKLTIGLMAAFLLVIALLWFWLLHTSSGARMLLSRAEIVLPLEVDSIAGSLASGVTLRRVRYNGDLAFIERLQFALDVDLLWPSMRLHEVQVDGVDVTLAATTEASSPAPPLQELLPRLTPPLPVRVDELTLTDFELHDQDAAVLLAIEYGELRGSYSSILQVEHLLVRTPSDTIEAQATLGLQVPHRLNASVSGVTTRQLLDDQDRVEFDVSVNGEINRYAINGAANAKLGEIREVRFVLNGHGTTANLRLVQLTAEGPDVAAKVSGGFEWADDLQIDAKVDIDRANLHAVNANWPAAHPVAAKLDVGFTPGALRVADSSLSVAGTSTSVNGDVDIDLSAGSVNGRVGWQALRWPIGADEAAASYRSDSGTVTIAGELDDWRVAGSLSLVANDVAAGSIELEGSGDRETAHFNIANADLFGGQVRGDTHFSWRHDKPWSATLAVAGIRTQSLASAWPGVVSGEIDASGQAQTGAADIVIRNLNGSLREKRLLANGEIKKRGDSFSATDLAIEYGSNDVRLNGDVSSNAGLHFDAAIGALGEILPDADGSLEVSGRVALVNDQPLLRIAGEAQQLSFDTFYAEQIRIVDSANADELIGFRLEADELRLQSTVIRDVEFGLAATADQQSIQLAATAADARVAVRLEGTVDDLKMPGRWDGQLSGLEIQLQPGSDEPLEFALASTAGVAASRDELRIDRSCIASDSGEQLCAGLSWQRNGELELMASLTKMPLALINRYSDTGFVFEQRVDGEVSWLASANTVREGHGELRLSSGRVLGPAGDRLVAETDDAVASFAVTNGRQLSANLQLPMPGTGTIEANFELADINRPGQSPIDGDIDFSLSNLALLGVVSPLIDSASGSLHGNFAVGGQLDAIAVTGSAELENGDIHYLPIGLHLTEISLNTELLPGRQARLEGSFRAGDGRAHVTTEASFNRDAGIQVSLSGEGLTIIDVPDLRAVANIDTRIGFRDDTLSVDGEVLIPSASLHPDTLPASRAAVSDDVVIVAGELPEGKPQQQDRTLKIVGDLKVALGDDVVVDLDVARATVSGSAGFEWRGDPVPVADGRYTMAGDIQAFGQVLEIVEGDIRFPRVPASNPQLRIRAEREIYGNTQVRTAGVLVAGTIEQPSISAYTYPATTEERALSLLVTGSDFDFEQGVGAIDFGTYVAPRLFVSYGVGLFGRDNVISSRYDIASGFGIKATSGQKESGIDLIYRFER